MLSVCNAGFAVHQALMQCAVSAVMHTELQALTETGMTVKDVGTQLWPISYFCKSEYG